MAKVNAPLFSFGASGKIANSLVYFPWKGLNLVRKYVIPANPKTALQMTQRGFVAAAVAAIHAAQALAAEALAQVDITAYAALAGNHKTPRTWFNEIVKLWCDVKVSGNTPIIYCDMDITDKDVTAIALELQIEEETGSDLAAGKFFFGTSKTALIHSNAAGLTAGDSVQLVAVNLSAFLTAGVKYYVQFRPDVADPCEGAISGIYSFVGA